MTPEELLRPFLKKYELPDSLVRLLYLLIQREIETNFASLEGAADPLLKLARGLDHIFSKLPPIYEGEGFKASLDDLAGINEQDTATLFSLRRPVEWVNYYDWRSYIKQNIADYQREIDRGEADSYTKSQLRDYKEQLRELKEPEPEPYLTSFWQRLLSFRVSYQIPQKLRFQHTHIIGVPGTGKSELIKRLVYSDIQDRAGVIVMAPKGNLISDLARIPGERIWISDWSNVGLNLLDLDPSLIIYVFEALLESVPTPKQKAFLTQAVKSAKTLTDFRHIVAHTKGTYAETAEQVAWRLDLFPPIVEQILSRETTIHIQQVMDGGVLLLDTAQLKEGSSLIGRFVIALIAQATRNRKSRHPCYVYIDEAQAYLTEYIEEMLDQAREARVGLTLAHQNLSQLSSRLEQSILGTAIKYVGQVVPTDASKLAPLLKVEPKHLIHYAHCSFVLYAHGFLKHPLHIHIKPGFLDTFPIAVHSEHQASPLPVKPPQSTEKTDSEDPNEW